MATVGVAPPAAASAHNALFLIGFGMFLTVSVLPALLSALVRSAVILAILSLVCAGTNPTDHSFAVWVSKQEDLDVRMKEKPALKQWVSAIVKTAIAMVTNERITWTYHNVLLFSVVHIPSINRHAFGCCGNWWWADANTRLLQLCKAPWIARFTKGGIASGVERYLEQNGVPHREGSAAGRSQETQPGSRGGPGRNSARHRTGADMENAATAFASSLSGLAASLQSSLSESTIGSFSSESSTATGISDRQLRAKALQAKIKKDWREAAKYFLEASSVALSLLSRTNYRLEAAWCELEDSVVYPNPQSQLAQLVEAVCEELSSAGYFDEAARALSEFALRLRRKFPHDTLNEDLASDIASMYLRAKNIAEAGGNARSALENGLRAAGMYAEAAMWHVAEDCFEGMAKLHLKEGQPASANECFGDAVLCRIGQLDVTGADQLAQVYRQTQLKSEGMSEDSELDKLLESTFKAYEKWSVQILDSAITRFESRTRLQPWQRQCLANVRDKLNTGDLR